jgi:hypothetical protein
MRDRYLYVCRGCSRQDLELHEPRCPTCGNDESVHTLDLIRIRALVDNLFIAGMLCRAFALGEYFERDMQWPPGTWRRDCAWSPGCGPSAP